MTTIPLGVSVIICTYNGSKTIIQTIEHLFAQKCSDLQWEILIVDNASTDSTFDCVHGFISASSSKIPDNLSVSLLKEPKSGKTYALDKGFETASYQYIIICDDDNWLDENYVQTAYNIMQSDSDIGIVGGLGEPICEISPPWWFESLKEHYATGPQNPVNGEVQRGWVFGAGMVVRKIGWILLKENNYKNILTCRKGEELSAGGDVEMCYNYSFLDLKVYYDNRLLFKHYLPKKRLTWNYVISLYKGASEADVFLYFMRFSKATQLKSKQEINSIYTKKLKKDAKWLYNNWRNIILLKIYSLPEGNIKLLNIYYSFNRIKSLIFDRRKVIEHLHQINTFKSQFKE